LSESKSELKANIIKRVGESLFKKAKDFPNNNIKIISIQNDPLFVRALFFDNEREFHIIIDEEKREIFHDCPSFLIYSNIEKKLCKHLLKLFLILKQEKSLEIIKNLNQYNLTSEDFGSEKKRKNFQIIANKCFQEKNNIIEGLNYLNKAIISEFNCAPTIKKYLEIAIKNDLLIELFEFLKNGYQNDLGKYLEEYKDLIESGFKKLINSVEEYSFYNLLRIIHYLNEITKHTDLPLLSKYLTKLKKMVESSNLNQKYFSIYFVKKNYESLIEINEEFKSIFSQSQLNELKNNLIELFIEEIEDFCILDKLKLMKSQFNILEIPEEEYKEIYENYKNEIKELEKKVYLKKFSFLKLLMEKYDVKRTNVSFRKKRNVYIVNHDEENLQNATYFYIIKKLGFFGDKTSAIKSSDLGINYFIIRDLFLDDLKQFPDIFYYKNQFWGDEDYQINIRDGIPLLRQDTDYTYDIEQEYSNENVMIIEWDLAKKPIKGSLINASSAQIIIPDQNNPLFHDLKPFDLCYCIKTPIKIEANVIKIVNVITKCSFKDAIKSVSQKMEFIEGYYPLSLVRAVKDKEIDPFKANRLVTTNPNRKFIPNYSKFVKEFRKFLFRDINEEKEYIFEEIKKDPQDKADQILILLNLSNNLNGMNLPYSDIIKNIIKDDSNLDDFKKDLMKEIHKYIKTLLKGKLIGSTNVFNLKKMKNTPFIKYSNEILNIRKEEFEKTPIYKADNLYDISELKKTYYGNKIKNILKFGDKDRISFKEFRKFNELSEKLNLKINLVKT